MNVKKMLELMLMLMLQYWHEQASAHESEHVFASVLTRATILGTLCISRHLSGKISDELVSNPIWPRQTDELIPVSGVNFINILQAAFVLADPESAKKTDYLTAFLHFWYLRV